MNLKSIKATLLVAFIILTGTLTYWGLNKKEATIDFNALSEKRNKDMQVQSEESFNNILKNIGNSTTVVKPEILQSEDTSKLSLSIQLLDTMKQHLYAAVLSEKLANLQNSAFRYHMAARYYLMATEKHENELMLYKKARVNLNKCIELDSSNLDAQVDLAVSVYNINSWEPSQNPMDMMQPAKLLLGVVKRNPNHIDALYYLAKLSIETKQYEKAIERFKKLVSLQPQNREFYLELSGIYSIMGNEQESKLWLEKAKSIQ